MNSRLYLSFVEGIIGRRLYSGVETDTCPNTETEVGSDSTVTLVQVQGLGIP
jgi:hypothetical protein